MVLNITGSYFSSLEDEAHDQWVSDAAVRLFATYQEYFENAGVNSTDLEPLCHNVRKWAKRYALTGRRDVFRLCLVAVSLGSRFWQDPRFGSYIDTSVGNQEIVLSRRVDALTQHSASWLSVLWADDDVQAFGLRLSEAVLTCETVEARDLQYVLPGHWSLFSPNHNNQFIAALLKNTLAHGLKEPSQKLAFVALALAYGFGWFNNPQYSTISNLIGSTSNAETLSEELRQLFGGMSYE